MLSVLVKLSAFSALGAAALGLIFGGFAVQAGMAFAVGAKSTAPLWLGGVLGLVCGILVLGSSES